MIDINKKYYLSTKDGFILVVDEDGFKIPFQVDIEIKQGCHSLIDGERKTPVYITLFCRYDDNGRKVKSSMFEEVKNITYEFIGFVDGNAIDNLSFKVCRISEDV